MEPTAAGPSLSLVLGGQGALLVLSHGGLGCPGLPLTPRHRWGQEGGTHHPPFKDCETA